MQSRRFDLSVSLVCLAILGYFGWHANKGPRSYGFHDGLEVKADVLQAEFDATQQTRIRLEHKVGLLRPESIDPDMLDEMARAQLEVAAPNELLAYQKP